jgi:hypothetical protein
MRSSRCSSRWRSSTSDLRCPTAAHVSHTCRAARVRGQARSPARKPLVCTRASHRHALDHFAAASACGAPHVLRQARATSQPHRLPCWHTLHTVRRRAACAWPPPPPAARAPALVTASLRRRAHCCLGRRCRQAPSRLLRACTGGAYSHDWSQPSLPARMHPLQSPYQRMAPTTPCARARARSHPRTGPRRALPAKGPPPPPPPPPLLRAPEPPGPPPSRSSCSQAATGPPACCAPAAAEDRAAERSMRDSVASSAATAAPFTSRASSSSATCACAPASASW